MKTNVFFLIAAMLLAYANAQVQRPQVTTGAGSTKVTQTARLGSTMAGNAWQCAPTSGISPFLKTLRRTGIRHSTFPEVDSIRHIKQLLRKPDATPSTELMPLAPASFTPVVVDSWSGNAFNGYYPNDNHIAVGNDGKIVSVQNSSFEVYDSDGTVLASSDFDAFFNDGSLTGILYDPKVMYDPEADRFVMVVLHGSSSGTTKVMMCFSQTSDPSGSWWVYKLNGNITGGSGTDVWFDYPNLGITNDEVIVTGNLFDDSGVFSEVTVLQIDKDAGYAGASLSYGYWYDITTASGGTPFTLVPVSYGHGATYGPGMYLVSTSSSAGSKINLFEITNTFASGSASMNSYDATTPSYNIGGDADQAGTTNRLDVGDCRIKDAFLLDGTIHFVFTDEFGSTGYNGINYNRLQLSPLSNTSIEYGANGEDLCYPSLASYSTTTTSKDVVITYLRSKSSIFPEMRVVNCDHAGAFGTSTLVKAGVDFVDISSGSTERWGDYTGTSRKHNTDPPLLVVTGSYGNTSNENGTWIAWISNGGFIGIEDPTASKPNASVFPMPVIDLFQLNFEITTPGMTSIRLFDAQGKLVRLLFEDHLKTGPYEFSFNRNALPAGTYFLRVASPQQDIAGVPVIVQ